MQNEIKSSNPPVGLHGALNTLARWCGAPPVLRPRQKGYVRSLQELNRQFAQKINAEQNSLSTAIDHGRNDPTAPVERRKAGRAPIDEVAAIWVEVGAGILRKLTARRREKMNERAIYMMSAGAYGAHVSTTAAKTIQAWAYRARELHRRRVLAGVDFKPRTTKEAIIAAAATTKLAEVLPRLLARE